MQNGVSVYNEMNQEINRARAEAKRVADELATLTVQLHQARAAEAQQTIELARLRLDLLAADQIASGFDVADQRALALLQTRAAELEQLNLAIAISIKQQETLDTQHEKLLVARDQALSALNAKIETTRRILYDTAEFRKQHEYADALALQARYATEKADLAEKDRIEKRQPYEQDRLFIYLWERRFGFPEYQSGPLIRTLDAWVARLVAYDQAHRNYRLLLALADHMREHALAQERNAASAAAQLAALDQAALDAAGVSALQMALTAAETDLRDLNTQLEQEELAHKQLLEQRAAIVAGTDSLTTEAMKVLEAQMAREDLSTLRRDVQITHTPKDDALVAKLANLRAVSGALGDRVSALQATQIVTLKQLGQMEELRTRFRNQGYDSGNSEFEDAVSIGGILQAIFRGAIEISGAWEQVQRRQKFRIPRAVISSISDILGSNGSWGRGSSRGGGGFLTGGRIGSGGFKSGGGF